MSSLSSAANAMQLEPHNLVTICIFSMLDVSTVTPLISSSRAVANAYNSGVSTAIPSENPGSLLQSLY